MHRILHIAPMNYAGVPYSFYDMHLKCGDYSRIVTFHKNERDFPEDICLNWPLPRFKAASVWRRKKVAQREASLTHEAPEFKPKNFLESFYFSFNDSLRKRPVQELIEKYRLNEFEIIHYDAGLDFFRDSSQAKKWKREGKKIVCCYYGSDLRTRGLIKDLDLISDLNITSEFDHLALKKDLQYVFYPYDPSELPEKKSMENEAVTIVHSPTNRKYKGTELILSVIEKIKKEKNIRFLLLENMPRDEVLEIKSKSDISIDQVGGTMGGTGYGKAGIETIGIGLPTITNMTKEYEEWLPENPFVVANDGHALYNKLCELIESEELRKTLAQKGKEWLRKYHSYESVNKRLYELYKEKNIV
ncbi:MAG TPA: glycosyltransferase [Ignavibacteriales bacterium]|nr:glycosyltransferase [Ignavibacteriales bacterium]